MNVEEAKAAIYSFQSRSSPINDDPHDVEFIEFLYRAGFEISFEKKRKREQPLSFSKRLAISRTFSRWYQNSLERLKYNPEMLFISYLDKKGWLNTQKIMDQLTDSRIKAILGEGVADKLIIDDKKEEMDTDAERLKTKIDKIRKRHEIKKSEEENEV